MAVLEPHEGDPDRIQRMVARLSERVGRTSFSHLTAALRDQGSELFCSHLASTLKPVEARSTDTKSRFPVTAVLEALTIYSQLLLLYLAKEEIKSLEASGKLAGIFQPRNQTDVVLFKKLFSSISFPVPQPLMQAFGTNVDLAIACWSRLAWADRACLSAVFLVRDMFNLLERITIDGVPLSWKPDLSSRPCAIADGVLEEENVLLFLSAIAKACNGQIAFDMKQWEGREESVKSMCLQVWESKNFTGTGLIFSFKAKSAETIFKGGTLGSYRIDIRKKHTRGKAVASIIGGKEFLLRALQDHPLLRSNATACDLIRQFKASIQQHNATSECIPVVPATCCSSNLYLSQLETLADRIWVSTEVIDFAFTHHALLTGGCCNLFPDPLSDGPKIFYCDTAVYSTIVNSTRSRWKYDIQDYAFLYLPAHVDGNHYIGMGVSIIDGSGHLQSFDSLDCDRVSERRKVLAWLRRQAPNIEWRDSKGVCPLQVNNWCDCAILTFLCGTIFTWCLPEGT